MAAVAVENDWVLPDMEEAAASASNGGLVIEAGRHPLQEMCTNTFVPNPTRMSVGGAKMMVMTGPNACGKSVYLKQVGIIVYLAHLGSFVPAASATVPIFDRIVTRIQTLETLSLGLSAFAVDVNQMSLALRSASASSLVLVDEFGKGTDEKDGQVSSP